MRPRLAVFFLALAGATPAAVGAHPGDDHHAPPATRPAGVPMSPAEREMEAAERLHQAHPDRPEPLVARAMALTRRARETGDSAYYDQAEVELDEAASLAPEDYGARRVRAWVLMGKHQFARARKVARELNARAPDDLLVWAVLVDSNVELGDYAAAEEAAQIMLDLRPAAVGSLTRGAYIRELIGDPSGAAELMADALRRTPADQVEDRAWTLVQLSHLALAQGQLDAAVAAVAEALELFPDYHYALAQTADVRLAQGRAGEAADLRRRHVGVVSDPDAHYFLADALAAAGRDEEAAQAFADFERAAGEVHEHDGDVHTHGTRQLILHYAGRGDRPAEALRLAQEEAAGRQDVYTLDAYAVALLANDRPDAAREQIEKALSVGIKDAAILFHAAQVAAAQGDADAAERYARQSLDANPHSRVAPDARAILDGTPTTRPQR